MTNSNLKTWTDMDVPALEAEVRRHNQYYWVDNRPEIADADYDQLVELLRSRSPTSPVLDAIGPAGAEADVIPEQAFRHDPPMLSLAKCYDEETLLKWEEKFPGGVTVTPKVDGVAVCIRFDASGRLQVAATRGDGRSGEIITENVRRIVNIPAQIAHGPLEIRGEAYMPVSVFEARFAQDSLTKFPRI